MTMLKNNKWKLLISSILILLPIAAGVILWDRLPDNLATHWGINGEADGWSSKGFSVFGMPAILLLLHWVCMLGTAFDKKNKEQNKKIFGIIFWIIPVISICVQGAIYLTALNIQVDMFNICMILFAVMFFIIGNYIPKAKQNRTLGVKISWTLKYEDNWNATHRFTGKLWVICSLLTLGNIFVPLPVKSYILFGIILLAVIPPFVYSYLFYKKHNKGQTK